LKNTKPIIVGGCMRSGTTLLSAILDSHPNIACGYETEMFTVNNPIRNIIYSLKLGDGITNEFPRKAFEKVKHRLIKYPHIDALDIEKIYKRCKSNRAEFASSFFGQYASSKGKLRWAEKSPGNTFHMHALMELLPSAIFVHIVRDFRDFYLSIKKYAKHRKRGYSLLRAAYYYRRNALVYEQTLAMQDRCIIIRYEDLLLSFQDTLEKLFEFLGEETSEKCLEFWKYQHDISRKYHVSKAQEAIDESNCFKYRKEMSELEQKFSWYLCGDVMRIFNYTKE